MRDFVPVRTGQVGLSLLGSAEPSPHLSREITGEGSARRVISGAERDILTPRWVRNRNRLRGSRSCPRSLRLRSEFVIFLYLGIAFCGARGMMVEVEVG